LLFIPGESTFTRAASYNNRFSVKNHQAYKTMNQPPNEVTDEELKKVIADFLDQGHVENIVAMFRREPKYYAWTADILSDERFSVRLGVSVLFEELQVIQPDQVVLAIAPLAELLHAEEPLIRGEAVSVLGIIGTKEAMAAIQQLQNDPNPQVREMVQLVLEG
jgi:predicted component of type VI protein secretion system